MVRSCYKAYYKPYRTLERGNLVGASGNGVTMFSWGNQYVKQVGIATVKSGGCSGGA